MITTEDIELIGVIEGGSVTEELSGEVETPVVGVDVGGSVEGIRGPKGDKGDKGDTGAQGPQGEKGEKGEQGEKGDKGEKGDTGAQGPAGTDGRDGQDGAPGADGADGHDGADGQDGADGVSPTVTTTAVTGGTQVTITDANGPHTFTVLNGVDGQNGQDGQDGAPGADGADGHDGADGQDGADGHDADVDFTELTAPTISGGATTITFAADQRNGVEFSTNADLAIALVSNNKADNYIWITNSHATTAIDITFSSIMFGSTAINDIKGAASIPSIEAGETLEIGIYVTNSKARITSRIL